MAGAPTGVRRLSPCANGPWRPRRRGWTCR